MYRIQNLVNSPYQIGDKTIPARGVLECDDLTAIELNLIKSVGYFKIEEIEKAKPAKAKPAKRPAKKEA